MNTKGFKLPKKKSTTSTAMRMLHNPTVDRKNKVAENRLCENIHELEMEHKRFGASLSREKVTLKHELRGMREELEKPAHEYFEMPNPDIFDRLMSSSPSPQMVSPRPISRAHTFTRRPFSEQAIQEEEEELEEGSVPRPQSRKVLPRSSHEDRSIEKRMNNIHKRYALHANSQKSIQELQRQHEMSKDKRKKSS